MKLNSINLEVHDYNLAVNVKNEPRLDGELTEKMDKWVQEHLDDLDFMLQFDVPEAVDRLEKNMQELFPSYNINVNQTGRMGGWLEITGNWSIVDAKRAHNPRSLFHDRINNAYSFSGECATLAEMEVILSVILPAFIQGVLEEINALRESTLEFIQGHISETERQAMEVTT